MFIVLKLEKKLNDFMENLSDKKTIWLDPALALSFHSLENTVWSLNFNLYESDDQ